jgi:hypothetical protein
MASCLLGSLFVVGAGPGASAGRASCFEDDATRHGLMRGDVDGDGNRDAVWILAKRPGGRCRYYVKADLGDTEDRKRLRADRFVMRNFSRVMAMVEVDSVPGKEFGVVLEQGASTVFAGLFTIRADTIRRMHINGDGAPAGNLFAYGGSINFQFASDCARNRPPNQVVYSEAVFDSDINRYRVKRRWFQVVGVDFERTSEDTQKERVRPGRLHERFHEFRNNPFGSCPGRVKG